MMIVDGQVLCTGCDTSKRRGGEKEEECLVEKKGCPQLLLYVFGNATAPYLHTQDKSNPGINKTL